ncbi:hypothetical protein [Clostridium butyricum]|uniref:Uncharacterized protein n=1 Tax=Clostridium butyricum E4 str. BoNT E BL5262 TaxID=632245 RepID=C4IL95_CLOBU|nr:hypothetical protein [Clostridium butyricum]EDT76362.1 hypothetical protein CBY_0618 [Clostridium butyricum 5521]EEP53409.1 hypothetical protein CLP_1529 [Clostridium butyricum E4 str. BoNT E BL5262]NFL30705.1 hypothetical protein [Clostridium butyricum]NFS18034.1 hypothetical protein [Clostridium butyricum]
MNKCRKSFIFFVIPKNQWLYFSLLSLGVVIALVQVLRYCDSPIWPNMPKYFKKPENADMLLYNLSVSYVVSYMFYLMVNFIPDCVKAINKEKRMLPYRATIQREVQQFVSNIIYLWRDVGVNATIEGKYNIADVKCIDDFFKVDVIGEISKSIKLEELVNDSVDVDVSDWHFIWNTKLRRTLDNICEAGNLILTRYKEDIPAEIFYDIFYLLNESNIVGELLSELKAIASMKNGRNFRLSTCIGIENNKEKNIKKSCESIIKLYNWINTEYEYFDNNIDIKINGIYFNKMITQKL